MQNVKFEKNVEKVEIYDNCQKRHRHFPTSPDTSGKVGKCQEMSGTLSGKVGKCREMSGNVGDASGGGPLMLDIDRIDKKLKSCRISNLVLMF